MDTWCDTQNFSNLTAKVSWCSQLFITLLLMTLTFFSDDEESGDDEDVLSRNAIKRYSQQIVDSKTKKHKTRKGKRKTKQ